MHVLWHVSATWLHMLGLIWLKNNIFCFDMIFFISTEGTYRRTALATHNTTNSMAQSFMYLQCSHLFSLPFS